MQVIFGYKQCIETLHSQSFNKENSISSRQTRIRGPAVIVNGMYCLRIFCAYHSFSPLRLHNVSLSLNTL